MTEEVTYKLVDKEGFLAHYHGNVQIVEYMKGGTITGILGEDGELELSREISYNICNDELFLYFKKVEPTKLWDGIISKLKVGLTVRVETHETLYEVIHFDQDERVVLLKNIARGKLSLVKVEKLTRSNKSPKELAFEKWSKLGLDTKGVITETVFNTLFEIINEEEK